MFLSSEPMPPTTRTSFEQGSPDVLKPCHSTTPEFPDSPGTCLEVEPDTTSSVTTVSGGCQAPEESDTGAITTPTTPLPTQDGLYIPARWSDDAHAACVGVATPESISSTNPRASLFGQWTERTMEKLRKVSLVRGRCDGVLLLRMRTSASSKVEILIDLFLKPGSNCLFRATFYANRG